MISECSSCGFLASSSCVQALYIIPAACIALQLETCEAIGFDVTFCGSPKRPSPDNLSGIGVALYICGSRKVRNSS